MSCVIFVSPKQLAKTTLSNVLNLLTESLYTACLTELDSRGTTEFARLGTPEALGVVWEGNSNNYRRAYVFNKDKPTPSR